MVDVVGQGGAKTCQSEIEAEKGSAERLAQWSVIVTKARVASASVKY